MAPQAPGRATTNNELDALKQDFITACRILVSEGVTQDAFNVSCRIPGEQMLVHAVVSPTLVNPDNLEIYSIAEGPKSYRAHPAIYSARPDVNAIVHCHPPYTVAFSTLGEEFRPVHHYGAPFHGKLAVYRSPGQTKSDDRAQEVARQLGHGRVILQQGHGCIMVGKDLAEAVLCTLYLEEACKILAIARQMGKPQYLSLEESETISAQILKERSQKKGWKHFSDKLRLAGYRVPGEKSGHLRTI